MFIIKNTEGKLDPGMTTTVKVGFNPYIAEYYEQKVPLYLDGDTSKPYKEIVLRGEGAYPKMLFDRKEIILPIVPLGIPSRSTFNLINDGYENLNLRYVFP